MDVTVYLSREADGSYSAYADERAPINYGLIGEGKTPQEAINEWNNMYVAMKQSYEEDNMPFVEATFHFAYDVPSFLCYYSTLIPFSGLSKLTGVSATQLLQYANGNRNPKPQTAAKIQAGLKAFAADLSQLQFV